MTGGYSRDKFIKGTDIPKRAGNFSASTIHYQSRAAKDYRVRLVNGKLIVGDNTPLSSLFPEAVVELALNDPYFDRYTQKGTKTVGNKPHDAYRSLKRFWAFGHHSYNDFRFIYTEEIYTDNDFTYNFPNY